MRICVYAASSNACSAQYHDAAYRLGGEIARAGASLVYGGGSAGSMGAVANGALSAGGKVIGVLPRFMADLEWGHPDLTELQLVEDMRERKHLLLTGSDAVVALPGGCGTLEELFEAITLKRLGLYFNPIILVNTLGFYDQLQDFLLHTIDQGMMNQVHGQMWQIVETPEAVLPAIRRTSAWSAQAREFAVAR